MTPARWQQIDELFQRVIDLDELPRRAILETCEDAELRREIEALVAADPEASPALRGMIEREAETMAGAQIAAHLGRRVGAYRLLELLGEGGMGVVYRAVRDDNEYVRDVAIKILRTGFESPQAIARFRDERQILARLDHPHIVRLLDGGTTDDDLPYLVMEHLTGVSITRHARSHALSVRQRLQLVVTICDAVHYAHALKIVHRDLKPSNILVGADGVPKLLDFGIAKLLDEASREARTVAGAALLTFAYASPEQLRAEATSPASDVYSLGAVLYELLADRPPHVGTTVEMVRVVSETDAPRASLVAPPARRGELAGDLDNILARALAREPARRYASMAAFGDDLRRYLDGMPVVARAPTLAYRAGKWLRRHRGVVAIAGTASLAVGLAVGFVWHRAAARAAEACLGSEERLAGVWDPAVRAQIEASFLATGRGHAADTVARASAVLDARTRAWVAMRTEACEATAVRHDQSPALLDLRMQCLDRHLGKLRALAELFAHADASLVDNAVGAIYQLAPLEACADGRGLLEATPPPDNAEAKARVAQLRDRLAHAQVLADAGRYREAETQQIALVGEARALGYPPVLGEALSALGAAQMYLYEDRLAKPTLEEAMRMLAAAKDDAGVATAWIQLVNVLGLGLSRPADALALRQGAETAILRAGGDRRLRALLDRNLGSALKIEGKYDEALVLQREALAIQLELLDPSDPAIGKTRNSIGVVLMHLGKYDEALAQYTETLAFFVRVYGPDHPNVAGVLSNIGNVNAYTGHYREAIAALERGLAIQEKSVGLEHPDVAGTLGSLGEARLVLGDLEGARRDLERATAICERKLPPDHLVLAASLRRAGAIRAIFGDADAGRVAIERALAIYDKKLAPDSPEIGETLGALAAVEAALGKSDESAATFTRALAIARRDHDGETEIAAATEVAAAEMFARDRATAGEALGAADRALATRERLFGAAYPQLGRALVVRGQALLALGRADATAQLERAVAVLEAAGPPLDLARARFALAGALGPQPRARELAIHARDALAAAGPPGARDLARVDAWLRR